jgi:ubiquinone/menaquinone biosynthesis C-methylase UbiE
MKPVFKNSENNVKSINEYQKIQYEKLEKDICKNLLSRLEPYISKYKDNSSIKILDIGGASGYFALEIKEYFADKNCEVTVVDNTVFDTWAEFSNRITFFQSSVDNLDNIFDENIFDLIFVNRVFHHLVRENWKRTIEGISNVMRKIYKILKHDGQLCITDHFYNGLIFDEICSKIIYMISSSTFKPILKMCKKMGSLSAGVGVCFLSYNMWVKLLNENNLQIEKLDLTNNEWIRATYKKILLLNSKNTLDNIIIAKKNLP